VIQPLRKIHRRVFVFLAVLLPLLFLAALRARHPVPSNNIAPRIPAATVSFSGNELRGTAAVIKGAP
jgi:hypothetical protein